MRTFGLGLFLLLGLGLRLLLGLELRLFGPVARAIGTHSPVRRLTGARRASETYTTTPSTVHPARPGRC
jgi:hypothetical protein